MTVGANRPVCVNHPSASERHRQAGQAAQDARVAPGQVLARHGEADLGEPGEERREGDLALQPGQRRPEAGVDARAEGEVADRLAADVEALGVGE